MLGFTLVGCGRIAQKHGAILGKAQITGARLAAVCDIVPQRAQELGERYSVPWFSDMHEMMQQIQEQATDLLTRGNSRK